MNFVIKYNINKLYPQDFSPEELSLITDTHSYLSECSEYLLKFKTDNNYTNQYMLEMCENIKSYTTKETHYSTVLREEVIFIRDKLQKLCKNYPDTDTHHLLLFQIFRKYLPKEYILNYFCSEILLYCLILKLFS
jgi:hypothetical protein